MSCPRVLLPPPVVKPGKLSGCYDQNQPLYRSLSMAPLKPKQRYCLLTDLPRRISLHSAHLSSSPTSYSVPAMPRSCLRRGGSRMYKKQVVFADEKGKPLTVEHLFTPEPSSPTPISTTRPSTRNLEVQQNHSNKFHLPKFYLGFPPPTENSDAFVARLQEKCVQMESCRISERILSGLVYVYHSSLKKTVNIRVTFDSWKSHKDITCKFSEHRLCHGLDVDVFTFDVSLPQNINQNERIEFLFTFSPGHGSTLHCDDNFGLQYNVLQENAGSWAGNDYTRNFYPFLSKYKPAVSLQLASYLQNCDDLKYLRSHLLSSRSFSGQLC
ncbi:PREDICTED: protein phosphatase 1 regulatory subunit 3B-B-like [Cyprinodon variegatus]|nr:PREDICTED: protein phosphatase 1 regulatory subunit 3B-B-like [Cyprinodon variegatus]